MLPRGRGKARQRVHWLKVWYVAVMMYALWCGVRQAGARTEACLAANKWQIADTKEAYMGGNPHFVLMLSQAAIQQRQRAFDALHTAQLDTKKKSQVSRKP